jgi:hypothetical protein
LSNSAKLLILVLSITSGIPQKAIASIREQDENDPARAIAVVREAIAARGGDAYLAIRTIVSRGLYSPFDKGIAGDPVSFVDYVGYPGRERTEFGKGDSKLVQANSDMTGWVYDARQKMIREQKEDQIKQFQQGARYDLDHLLRTASQQSAVKLVYLGRREPWRNTFSEAVRVDFSDGGAATLHFDPHSKLPLMIEYKTVGEEGTVSNEVRYYRWIDFNGIKISTIQDSYRDGKQANRVSFDSVSFNVDLPDKLFAKPSNIKEVK